MILIHPLTWLRTFLRCAEDDTQVVDVKFVFMGQYRPVRQQNIAPNSKKVTMHWKYTNLLLKRVDRQSINFNDFAYIFQMHETFVNISEDVM